MAIDKEYPGDSRMEPVDVDVLDNLINAQAAYLDATSMAAGHFGINGGKIIDRINDAITNCFTEVSGLILAAASIQRA